MTQRVIKGRGMKEEEVQGRGVEKVAASASSEVSTGRANGSSNREGLCC